MSTMTVEKKRPPKSVNRICAGIDVHRDFACVTVVERTPKKDIILAYQRFATTKCEMLRLREWLLSLNVCTAGIESTGKYWYAVFNALDEHVQINVYNAWHIKNIPGKKTDKSDSHWIAMVTMNETIKPSFIPNAQIRDARIMARHRKSKVQERTKIRQQAHSLLESCGVKISGVVSDLFGVSGKNLMKLIASGEEYDETKVQKQVRNQLCKKVPQLMIALDGYIHPTHRSTLSDLLDDNTRLTSQIHYLEKELRQFLLDTPEKVATHKLVCKLPGFSDVSSLILLSEIGFDLSSFPSKKHFCSWAGLCPGNHQSAGKSKSGRNPTRQKYLRSLFIEVALASVCRRGTFLQAKYMSLKSRIGANQAVFAIAHRLCRAVYLLIKEHKQYYELTDEYISVSQIARDKKTLARITARLGADAVKVLIDQNDELNN